MGIGDPIFDGLVHVRLSFHAARQAGRAERIVGDWFADGWSLLGGVVRDRLTSTPPVDNADVRGTFALPGAEESTFFESSTDRLGDYLEELGRRPWAIAALRAGATEGGTLLPYYRTTEYWEAEQFREGDLVQLTVESTEALLYGATVGEAAVAGFIERMARECDADYAEAGFGYGGLGTVVDSTTFTYWEDSRAAAREVLRGYSWLTLVPEPLVASVGGAETLRASGAFVSVTELDNGAVLLRATERFADYRNAEAARVFEVLRPILRPGTRSSAFRTRTEARGM